MPTEATLDREEAIRGVFERHGIDAFYVASTGYLARAVFAVADPAAAVLYMQGSMGLAPAIGLGIALSTDADVVVLNGDASLLMALGTTHTARDYAPANFFHYVLDNGCHESVGGQLCAALEPGYPGVTAILKVARGGKPPRVGIAPPDNSERMRAALTRRRVADATDPAARWREVGGG
jgi:thiamine pyrophosphate-dependent acetolactate synthase large subunit-like protein